MQFVRHLDGGSPTWGVETAGTVHQLGGFGEGEPALTDLLNPSYRRKVRRAVDAGALPMRPAEAVSRLAPVPRPGKIVCVGLNYHDHAEEQNETVPEQPLLFGEGPD